MTMPKLPHNTHVIYSEGLLNIQTQMLWKNANTKKNYNLNMSPTSHVFFLPSLTMKSHNTALFSTKSFAALEARDTTNIIPSKFTCHTILDAVHFVYVLVIALHVA